MKKVLAIVVLAAVMIGCAKVPITGRRQMKLLPEKNLIEMSKVQYKTFMDSVDVLPASDSRALRVKTIGTNIQKSVEKWMGDNGFADRLEGFEWDFKTVKDPTINAWCMPGGKVCVYTGIMDLAEDDDMLATVMGHEIAHAIARHGNERMSQQLALMGLGGLTGLTPSDSSETSTVYQKVYMGSATLGILKFSRTHETESDKLGLVFMKMAGYKPEKAVEFWEKMANAGGAKPPEILSTHPHDETRIKDIKEFLPLIDDYID